MSSLDRSQRQGDPVRFPLCSLPVSSPHRQNRYIRIDSLPVYETAAMSSQTLGLSEELSAYVQRVGVREPELLTRLRHETAKLEDARMQISPEHGQFFSLLLKLIGAKTCLEVGVFTGYSTLVTALAIPEDGRIVACDVSEEWTAIGRRYWREAGVEQKIDLRLAPAVQTLDALLTEGRGATFDFAFVDADKENYAAYVERAAQLLRPGGLLAIDNTLWSGHVIDPAINDASTNAIRRLNESLSMDERFDISLLPIGDGLTLARRR
jgi:predicted O-methyltransferase YrrM